MGTHLKYLVEEKVTVTPLLHLLEKLHDLTYSMKGRREKHYLVRHLVRRLSSFQRFGRVR